MTEPENESFQQERIVISNEDLASDFVVPPASTPPPAAAAQPAPGTAAPTVPFADSWPSAPPPPAMTTPPGQLPGEQLPGLRGGAPLPPLPHSVNYASAPGTLTWDQFLTKLGSNAVISGLTAGALGGFAGWAISEILDSPDRWFPQSRLQLDWDSAFWVMIFAIVLGFVLMGWEGFTSRSTPKMFREGGIGAAIGLGAGLVGGFVSQAIYAQLFSSSGVNILVRGLGWAIFGALVGLGLGVRHGPKSTVNGLLGGAGGGFVAGAVFQILGENGGTGGGGGLRMVGLTLTGIGIGLGIGVVTRARRDAWLLFSDGPMRGKEFILQATQTRVGSDYRCDIVLVKDPSVAPVQAAFVRQPNGTVAVTPQSAAPVVVNGIPSAGSQLRSGDTIVIGSSVLTYEQRAAIV